MAQHNLLKLNNKQRLAMRQEINRQILAQQERWNEDLEAMVLWTLHQTLGFGPKRLLAFREAFRAEFERMQKIFETDDVYPARYYLKQMGVDVSQLVKEDEDESRTNEKFE